MLFFVFLLYIMNNELVLPMLLFYVNAGTVPGKGISGCYCGLSASLLKDSRQAGMTIFRKEILETLHQQ